MPGDPVLLLLGAESNPSPEAVASMRNQLGLDQPVITQYFTWLWNALHLEFGNSLTNGYPVANYVLDNLPRTLELAFVAIIVATLIGVPLGIAAALKRRQHAGHGADFGGDHRNFCAGLYSRHASCAGV
jgi:peptide/nickel transport system permease protein